MLGTEPLTRVPSSVYNNRNMLKNGISPSVRHVSTDNVRIINRGWGRNLGEAGVKVTSFGLPYTYLHGEKIKINIKLQGTSNKGQRGKKNVRIP